MVRSAETALPRRRSGIVGVGFEPGGACVPLTSLTARDLARSQEDDRLDGPQSSAAEEDHLLLAPDEVRHYLDDAGFASVYLKARCVANEISQLVASA